MIVITKREFGVDLDLTSIIYSYGSFLFFEAVDCKQNRYFVTYSLVGSKEEQLQTQYTERYADYCVIRKMIPIPGGTCCCIIISAEWNALANTSIISKELHCLESAIGLNSNEISCRIVVEPPQCIGADILWNRFDIRYSSNVKWCEVKCGESRYMVAVHDEGRRLRIGILFFPLGVEVIRTLLAYLFDTHPSAEIISYQTTGFSLLESWKSVQEQRSICFVLNLDSMHSGIEQRSSRKTRYNLNRSRQLLEKAVGSLEVQAFSADNCPHEIVERYFKMKTARYVWRNGKMVPEIEDEIWLARFRELIDIIRSLLVDTGLLFISINDREGAYCRVICDEVFGKQNFMAQIVRRRTKNPPCANVFSREHEYIIVFSNNSKQVHEEWNQPPISTWWDSAGTDEDAVHEVKEQLGKLKFDYPKPSTLIERCIEICQNKSARVLDVFAGSGTTAVAVENANLKDNGRRSYTLIQRNELYQGINIADICYKRVQRTIIGSRIAQRCIVYTRSNDGTSDLLSR